MLFQHLQKFDELGPDPVIMPIEKSLERRITARRLVKDYAINPVISYLYIKIVVLSRSSAAITA